MSRYILSPSQNKNLVLLIPTEGITDTTKSIELPTGIFPKFEYNDLLVKLSKANVRRNKDGLMLFGNKSCNVDYDTFVSDCCSGDFKSIYEPIYCQLRDFGITF